MRRITLCCILFSFGVAFVAIGIVDEIVWPAIYHNILANQMTLSPTGDVFSIWQDPPFPIYMRVYFFNCTNSENVTDHQATPDLQQLGPYTFKEERIKRNITWHGDNHTVSYREVRVWHFDESLSSGSLDDLVTTLNVPVITAGYELRNNDSLTKEAIDAVLTMLGEKLFMTASVGDLLFDGYNSSFINYIKLILPDMVPYDKFGWFYKRNGSDDGIYNVFTGHDHFSKSTVIDTWNFQKNTTFWNSTGECNIIKGTVGELWPPGQKKGEPITFFISDICRTLTLEYKEATDYDGISVYKYVPSEQLLANSSVNPANECYEMGDEETPGGLVDESTCKFGAPAFLSFPHFYMADPSLAQAVNGLNATNSDEYETTILMEPLTGAPLSVEAKLQINLLLENISGIQFFSNIKQKTYFPMFWFAESVEVQPSSDLFVMLKKATVTVPLITMICGFVLILAGTLMIVPAVYFFCKTWQLRRNSALDPPLLKNDDDVTGYGSDSNRKC